MTMVLAEVRGRVCHEDVMTVLCAWKFTNDSFEVEDITSYSSGFLLRSPS